MVEENVSVFDDGGIEILEAQHKSLLEQKEVTAKALQTIIDGRKNYAEQWEIEQRMRAIMEQENNWQKITPEFRYETIPEWVSLIAQLRQYKLREETFMAEAKLRQYDARQKDVEQQLMDIEARTIEVEARLAKALTQ
jgi:hypothetical protein